MKKAILSLATSVALLAASGCASLSQSLALGGAGGAAIGAYTGSAVYSGPKKEIRERNTLLGAAIGLGTGLLTSYLLHGYVENRLWEVESRNDARLEFGELPPNPFAPMPMRGEAKLPTTKPKGR